MNIYYIAWVQENSFNLNAVVISEGEKEALAELDLDDKYNDEIKAYKIGNCTDGTKKSQIVCKQSL